MFLSDISTAALNDVPPLPNDLITPNATFSFLTPFSIRAVAQAKHSRIVDERVNSRLGLPGDANGARYDCPGDDVKPGRRGALARR